jgi:hypothetical protein
MTKQQTLDTLKTQLPGFYSAEQVIEMISKIEEPQSKGFSFNEEQINELVSSIVNEVTDLGIDAIDDYDLSMNYKEVELDSIDFDDHSIKRAVNDAIDTWIENYMKKDDCGC